MASLQSFSKHKRTVRWKKCPSVLGGKALEAGSAEKEPERHHRAFVRDKDKGASSWETFELCKLLLNLSTVGAWLKCPRKGFRTGEGAQICQLYWGIEYSSLWDQIHKNLKKKCWFSGFVLNLLSLLRHWNFMESSEDKALQGRVASANTELQVRGDKTLS